jgi:transcriptional regulator with XRE-family HTH domain
MEFHPIGELDAQVSPEVLTKAHKLYERESLNMRLKALRGKYGVKQGDIAKFTQTAVSKLERRRDIKISTLIDYIESLDMGLEIIALPKDSNAEREILLKV